jgi:succinoglycan biosynthesis protein ExoA
MTSPWARPRSDSPAEALPLVSVLLVVRNEATFIGGCIEALDYPHERLEVLLIDGESSDGTIAEARSAAAATGLSLRLVENHRRITAAGLNLGIDAARGEVIVRVDGHTRVAPGFVSGNVRALRESGADAAGGRIETLGEGPTGRAIALAMSSKFGIGDAGFRHAGDLDGPVWTESVPFAAYRRDVFERFGRFAEDINQGEDDEFNYRVVSGGGRILLTPEVRSRYYARGSFPALLRQYWGYGLAKAKVLTRHPERLRPRHLVPSALLATLLLGAILQQLDRRFAWLWRLAGGAYAVANLAASLRVAGLRRPGELVRLPIAFACIHFGAGAGMLYCLPRALRDRARESRS